MVAHLTPKLIAYSTEYQFKQQNKVVEKGVRGLSVWLLLLRICTKISISLGTLWRQWRSRDAIHAGRYLADREFRYLRTVRVTAAVY